MPVNLHQRSYGADPLVVLVPHANDHIAGITLCKSVCSNLSRRAGENWRWSLGLTVSSLS